MTISDQLLILSAAIHKLEHRLDDNMNLHISLVNGLDALKHRIESIEQRLTPEPANLEELEASLSDPVESDQRSMHTSSSTSADNAPTGSTFAVGDRVRYRTDGVLGTIVEMDEDEIAPFLVLWDDDQTESYMHGEDIEIAMPLWTGTRVAIWTDVGSTKSIKAGTIVEYEGDLAVIQLDKAGKVKKRLEEMVELPEDWR